MSYERLAELAGHAQRLAAAGSWEELERVLAQRAELAARLPAEAPPGARADLELAAAADAATLRLASDARRRTLDELALIERARRTARSYGGPPAGARFDGAA